MVFYNFRVLRVSRGSKGSLRFSGLLGFFKISRDSLRFPRRFRFLRYLKDSQGSLGFLSVPVGVFRT